MSIHAMLPQPWAAARAQRVYAYQEKGPPGAPRQLDIESAWALATNDQFGLAQLVTPTHTHPALGNLSKLTLSSRFNWRGRASNAADLLGPGAATNHSTMVQLASAAEGPIVVMHDGSRKRTALTLASRVVRGSWRAINLQEITKERQRAAEAKENAWRSACPHRLHPPE